VRVAGGPATGAGGTGRAGRTIDIGRRTFFGRIFRPATYNC